MRQPVLPRRFKPLYECLFLKILAVSFKMAMVLSGDPITPEVRKMPNRLFAYKYFMKSEAVSSGVSEHRGVSIVARKGQYLQSLTHALDINVLSIIDVPPSGLTTG
jgi:hypothetical protein